MTPDAIADQLEWLVNRLRHGCGNTGCKIKEPAGMHTNGSCTCQPKGFASQLIGLAIECERHGKAWQQSAEGKP